MSPTTSPLSLSRLLELARSGDAVALERLVERYRAELLDRIRLMLGEEARRQADSVDFLQGVFVEVLARVESGGFSDERGLLRWMTTVARNDIRDRGCRRRELAFASLSGSGSGSLSLDAVRDLGGRSPATEAGLNEELLRMVEALERLAADHRRVIELRDLEELPFREVGRRMARSPEAAQLLHARAMLRLGRILGGAGA